MQNCLRSLSPPLSSVEVGIEADDDQIVFVGSHILIGIIEIESELLRAPGNIPELGRSQPEQRHAAGKEQIFNRPQEDIV